MSEEAERPIGHGERPATATPAERELVAQVIRRSRSNCSFFLYHESCKSVLSLLAKIQQSHGVIAYPVTLLALRACVLTRPPETPRKRVAPRQHRRAGPDRVRRTTSAYSAYLRQTTATPAQGPAHIGSLDLIRVHIVGDDANYHYMYSDQFDNRRSVTRIDTILSP